MRSLLALTAATHAQRVHAAARLGPSEAVRANTHDSCAARLAAVPAARSEAAATRAVVASWSVCVEDSCCCVCRAGDDREPRDGEAPLAGVRGERGGERALTNSYLASASSSPSFRFASASSAASSRRSASVCKKVLSSPSNRSTAAAIRVRNAAPSSIRASFSARKRATSISRERSSSDRSR